MTTPTVEATIRQRSVRECTRSWRPPRSDATTALPIRTVSVTVTIRRRRWRSDACHAATVSAHPVRRSHGRPGTASNGSIPAGWRVFGGASTAPYSRIRLDVRHRRSDRRTSGGDTTSWPVVSRQRQFATSSTSSAIAITSPSARVGEVRSRPSQPVARARTSCMSRCPRGLVDRLGVEQPLVSGVDPSHLGYAAGDAIT